MGGVIVGGCARGFGGASTQNLKLIVVNPKVM